MCGVRLIRPRYSLTVGYAGVVIDEFWHFDDHRGEQLWIIRTS